MTMNKEMINLLNDLRDFAANRVPINIESLKNTIKLYGYNIVVSERSKDAKIGIFEDFKDLCPFDAICVIHYIYINENDILVTCITNSKMKELDFVLY